MNSKAHHNGASQTSGLALVFTSLINSCVIASEMALLAPPAARAVDNGARPPSSSPGTVGLRTFGGGR